MVYFNKTIITKYNKINIQFSTIEKDGHVSIYLNANSNRCIYLASDDVLLAD